MSEHSEPEDDQWGSGLSFSIPSDDTLEFSNSSADFIDSHSVDGFTGTQTSTRSFGDDFTQASTEVPNETFEPPKSAPEPEPAPEPKKVETPKPPAPQPEPRREKPQKPLKTKRSRLEAPTTAACEARNRVRRQKSALEAARAEVEKEREREQREKRRRIARALKLELEKPEEKREKKISDDPKSVEALGNALDRAKASENVVRRSDRGLIIPSCRNKRRREEAEMGKA